VKLKDKGLKWVRIKIRIVLKTKGEKCIMVSAKEDNN
jgi:hypothetical protein